jgi:acetylornithine deacetylase
LAARLAAEEILGRLIAFDTTSRLSNLALIDWVRDYLSGHGVGSELVFDDTGAKANLYATIGPDALGGIVLSGHTDVVPVDGQDWSSDPFAMVEREGLLYGRGTADMKGFIACVLSKVPDWSSRALAEPVHLAFSYDEEVGCLGVHGLIEHVVRNHPRPRLAIVGEPTSMQVVDSHKGIHSFYTQVTGLEAHSSATHVGVSAIMAAAELIQFLSRLADELRAEGDPSGRFTPGYTTVSVGTIEGGTAINIIPRTCRFGWEFRPLPSADPKAILARFEAYANEMVLPRMRERFPEASIVTRPRSHCPPLHADPGSPAETLALALVGSNETHAVSYTTEASLFQKSGEIPTVVCGPGDILQAHRPDEFVARAQLEACLGFLDRLTARISA